MALRKDQQYYVYFDPDAGEDGTWYVRHEDWYDQEFAKVEKFQQYGEAADLCAILAAFARLDGYFGMYSFLIRTFGGVPGLESEE